MPRSRTLAPLKAVWTLDRGKAFPLPAGLARLYGRFSLPEAGAGPCIFSNFVATLDGVVSLHTRGHANGQDISGCNEQDRLVMGLLRAVADVVVVGAGTLAADRQHVWTPEMICPALASDFGRLRKALGKSGPPLNVIVSGSGSLDLRLPVFSSGAVQVMVITSSAGAKRLAAQPLPQGVAIRAVRSRGSHPRPSSMRSAGSTASSRYCSRGPPPVGRLLPAASGVGAIPDTGPADRGAQGPRWEIGDGHGAAVCPTQPLVGATGRCASGRKPFVLAVFVCLTMGWINEESFTPTGNPQSSIEGAIPAPGRLLHATRGRPTSHQGTVMKYLRASTA